MNVVRAGDQASYQLVLRADGKDLAAWIHEAVRIIRQLAEIESELRKLLLVEVALARNDRDVARRQLRSRYRLRINVHRRASKAGREAELPGNRGVGCQTIEPVHQVAGHLIGP